MPANSELPHNQRPGPGQTKLLSTHRVKSTIPQADTDDTWQYPSQQMFYNAMKRKGYNPHEEDMDSVIAIHNAVNERTWQEVLQWERTHCETCPTPKLLRFQGRPADLSPKVRGLLVGKHRARWRVVTDVVPVPALRPRCVTSRLRRLSCATRSLFCFLCAKARLKSLVGYSPPFDRHDWIVDRCGTPVRYVIDFYSGAPDPDGNKPVSVHIDARPALDSPGAFFDRLRCLVFGPASAPAEKQR
jgi:cytochrome c heme-lyase